MTTPVCHEPSAFAPTIDEVPRATLRVIHR
jgi:hypothetical protein